MSDGTTVLGLLKKARDLVSTGRHPGIIEAIASLEGEASGPVRDLAYHALLDTVAMGRGQASLAALAAPGRQENMIELFDATIRRITSALH
jgi:hypothetical protein